MLMNFSDLFRYALLSTRQQEIQIAEELKIIKQYLELLSIQYEDRLQYTIQIDEGLSEELIPPMILQLLIENGIKHGIALSREGGELMVTIQKEMDGIEIKVKNTGQLSKRASIETRLGTGLENIQKRLQLMYGVGSFLKLFETAPYVVAHLKIPFDKTPKKV